MEVGRLNKVVTFKSNTPTDKGAGAADSYATLLTTRGYLKKSSGSRGFSFGELSESSSWILITRYQQDIEDNLRMDMKLEIDGRTFTVTGWEKMEEKRFYYEIQLSEKVN